MTAGVVTVVVASTGVPTGLDGDPVTDGPAALAAPVAVPSPLGAGRSRTRAAARRRARRRALGPCRGADDPGSGGYRPGPGLVVGDSIALGSAGALRAVLGGDTTVDAKVGRQFAASPAIVEAWTRAHGGPVVVALGANGTVSRRDLDAVLAAAGSRRVVLVGVAVARRWRDGNNAVLRDAAARAPQVAFVDWAALVAANPGTLGPDGVHPPPRPARSPRSPHLRRSGPSRDHEPDGIGRSRIGAAPSWPLQQLSGVVFPDASQFAGDPGRPGVLSGGHREG